MSWIHWTKGARVGEWTSTEFASRDEAVAFARANVGATVIEIPSHHTLPHERVTFRADGTEVSTRCTTIG